MHQVIIVGCGSIGERHLRCFQKTGRAQVTACESAPALRETIAARYNVTVHADYAAALRGPGEAVVICTPAHLHVPFALQALAAGKHVLIEKPLSQSLANVDTLLQAHAASGRQAAVAYVYQVFPVLVQARDFLGRGELGAVKHVVLGSGQHFPTCRPAHAVPYAQTYYRDRRTGGGAIQDALTHVANWVESVIGPTDSLICDCAHQVLADVTVEDTVNLSARHGDILVNYTLNQFQAPNENFIQFNAVAGSVRIELHRQRWGVCRLGEADWTWHDCPVPERDAHFIAQANAFLDQIEGRPARLCSLAAAAQTLRFNLAALASADTGGARVRCADLHA
ncbi:MAG TPA: Gfo/Idh/MocA family oxidoreductase [Opitutaceae bacterium]|nr:Gfo/Idh/MocA family oxidoreductase [Opitutaceae bacterium]HRJ48026.1 Gfo/Idh/MocA family oxidoreductase [Opitutaceae bacterium]